MCMLVKLLALSYHHTYNHRREDEWMYTHRAAEREREREDCIVFNCFLHSTRNISSAL